MTFPPKISIIIPTLNEENNLPSLLSDISIWRGEIEIIVVDCGSTDSTIKIAKSEGAEVITYPEANRGAQLRNGFFHSSGEWLLFLHADSRLSPKWAVVIKKVILNKENTKKAFFFDFQIIKRIFSMRLLELAVRIRSSYFKEPYGDQGLLISRLLYEEIGMHEPIHLMEDLELVKRIVKNADIKSLGIPIYTDSRKWDNSNIIKIACKNAKLRKLWREGYPTEKLANKYYK